MVLPGQAVVFSTPNISGEVAIEPRWDSSHNKRSKESSFWPQPYVTEVVEGKVLLQNNSDEPICIKKSEPVCNLKLPHHATEEEIKSVHTLLSQTQSECKNTTTSKSSEYSSNVNLNPDGIMSIDEEREFKKLLSTYDEVFGPVNSTYNGHSGACYVLRHCRIYMTLLFPFDRKNLLSKFS